MDKIRIRPSSLVTYLACPYQWYNVFILGKRTIPSARASIGTAVHVSAEVLWNDAIRTGKVDTNLTMLTDAAMERFDELLIEETPTFDNGEDANTARLEIISGTKAFVDDVVPFTEIPDAVETRYTVTIDHPVVEDISGTLDYLKKSVDKKAIIADVKTSKRKIVTGGHIIQQSIYKYLVEENGIPVGTNLIQGVILNKNPYGMVAEMETDVNMAKYIVNSLLGTLKALYEGVDPLVLFRGNPKHYLCSDKYCSLRPTCPFVHGE